ncbi:hypothetical protein FE257_011763 [Aspergillus nanangensis]|uniref:Zn(2)-C6 fungal-type domain-containing protein n=1 Tax=Aspergillus nanangensis TaxID=2582783 RepID=A0AAD4CVJ1_ASPNN|nr:hypothetical protein FE257_011763 [Aspergillus nanangensis]
MPPYRVRFAPQQIYQSPVSQEVTTSHPAKPSRTRTRSGCRRCRERRVKCDETFPVCRACSRRGDVCQPALPASQWQPEVWCVVTVTPGLDPSRKLLPHPEVNSRLLRYWFECMCQIMTIDPESNPMSFPILQHLSASKSLVYIIQCISAAHEKYFQPTQMTVSLEERSKALRVLRGELRSDKLHPGLGFLVVLILGMSSSWITTEPDDFGREHLMAAHIAVDMALKCPKAADDELVHLATGFFVYWDMACSFCLDPDDHPPPYRPRLENYVKMASSRFHTIVSHSIDLYYLLGKVGRYCRTVADGFQRDLVQEMCFEAELNTYMSIEQDPSACQLTEAFRLHGLVMLYRLCGRPGHHAVEIDHVAEGGTFSVRSLALRILDLLFQIPLSSPYVNLHTIPLISAGAELGAEDADLRERVIQQLRAIYSTNRIPPTLSVIELLQELWNVQDCGFTMTWLELMLIKKWRLRIG